MKNFYFLIAAVLALFACSPSTSPVEIAGDVLPIAASSVGNLPAETIVEYSDANDTFTVTNLEGSVIFTRRNSGDKIGFRLYENSAEKFLLHYKETTSGAGFVRVIASLEPNLDFAATQFGRFEESFLPATGTANYTGVYLGIGRLIFHDIETIETNVTGEVNLSVDFALGQVSGAITERTSGLGIGGTATLNLADISGSGGFAGTATGGAYNDPTSLSIFNGLISGEDGSEIVGGLELYQPSVFVFGGAAYHEIGGFVAD